MSVWHWVLQQAATAALFTIVSMVVSMVVARVVSGTTRRMLRELREVRDLLDTHSPGGLRDVVDALEGRDHGD